MSEITKRVLQHFIGIDELRNNRRSEYLRLKEESDKYQPSFIRETKDAMKQQLINDRKERADKAIGEIEQIKEELTTRVFIDPYDEIREPVVRAEHKLLAEMQQARKLDFLKLELETAETADDVRPLIEEYGQYEHFFKLINLEIKKRMESEDNSTVKGGFTRLHAELNKEPEEVRELNKLYYTVKMLGNTNQHPVGLEEAAKDGDLSKIEFEKLLDKETVKLQNASPFPN